LKLRLFLLGGYGENGKMIETIAHIGPHINQQHLIAIVLALVIAATLLSAHTSRIDKGRVFCAKLNQRTASDLFWDGEGCVMKGKDE